MAYTIAEPCSLQEEIKKSRFLTRAFPLGSAEEFPAILEKIRAQPATHHCFAWKFGSLYRFHDDGEPTDTAGRPILAAIEGRNCDCIAIIVTRWYGGINLGTGGLARAYGGGAARALAQAQLVELVDYVRLSVHVDFSYHARIEKRLADFSARIESRDFTATGVHLVLVVEQQTVDNLSQFFADISRGRIKIEK